MVETRLQIYTREHEKEILANLRALIDINACTSNQTENVTAIYEIIDNELDFIIRNRSNFATTCLVIYDKAQELSSKKSVVRCYKLAQILYRVHDRIGRAIYKQKAEWLRLDRIIRKPEIVERLKTFTHTSLSHLL